MSCRHFAFLAVLAAACSVPSSAQPTSEDSTVHYVVRRGATLFQLADSTQPYASLRFREPVFVVENGGNWSRVRTTDGAQGLLRSDELSNIWIRVAKSTQTVFVYRGPHLVARYPADLGYNFFDDKQRRGSMTQPDEWRTPEGVFFVASRNPNSQFHRALVLNYPNAEDAKRGLRDSLITQSQYEAVLRSEKEFGMPPMNTALGGWIELHGEGTGRRANWTQGCIALRNDQMDQLWEWAEVGTPVIIER